MPMESESNRPPDDFPLSGVSGTNRTGLMKNRGGGLINAAPLHKHRGRYNHMENRIRDFRRGDVFLANLGVHDLGVNENHLQSGRRPIVIVQNDVGC